MKQQEKTRRAAVRQKIKNIFQLGLKELRGLECGSGRGR